MESLTLPLRALLDPVGAVPPLVEGRRWLVPLLVMALATAASGTALALRLDASRLVIPKLQMTGELAKASEREISEQIDQTQRVGIVAGVAKGVFLVPLEILFLAIALKITAWLIGRKALFARAFTVAAITMLPLAVYHLVLAVSAFSQGSLSPKMVEELVPSSLAAVVHASPVAARALATLDFFNLWAALLMGLGFSSATQLAPWKGLLVGVVLYVLFACAVFIGLPGLMAGGPGGGGPMGGPR